MTEQTVCLTIDDQQVRCPADCTIYEAATAAGIHIPTFCHHGKLTPVGACRMCLVQVEGAAGLLTSCTTPVRDGMVVKVHTSPAAVKARKANIEFLLTNHPLDCPVCDKGGECVLQDQAVLDGPGQSRYVEEKRHKNKRYPLGELIVLDQERCVLCWRCIRFLDEWADDHELDLFGRGSDTRVDTFFGRPLTSKWQGNTIDICPVGALTSRVFRFESRVWELTNTPSICPLCSVGCNVDLGIKNNELRRVTPRENMQVNDAWICDRGRFTHRYVDHADRLKTPLVRRDGALRPASWDEALGLVARRLGEIMARQGPGAIAGLASTRVTNEANYLFQRFFRSVVGTNNIDHLSRLPAGTALLSSLPDLENKDVILLLGFDPSTEAPMVELWIKKAVLRHGATVISAGPRRIELGRYGPSLGYRPGSQVALINGLARAVFDAGRPAAAARVANRDEFRSWLQDYTCSRVEELTGAAAGSIQRAGELLAAAQRPIILYGPGWLKDGVGRSAPSAAPSPGLLAVANLALLLGGIEAAFVPEDNNTVGAMEMGVAPHLLPGGLPANDPKVRSRLAGLWGGKLSPVDGLDCERIMSAAQEGEVQAIWIMGADAAADCRVAGEALGRVPFLVVQDLFLSDTAQLAEVVLPAASYAETDGSFTNLTGRLQALRAAKRPPGQAQPDWWIIAELARRMVDAKRQRSWDFATAGDVFDEIAKVLPSYRGLSLEALGESGYQALVQPPPTRRAFVRVEAASPDRPAPSLPLSPEEEYPFLLVTGRLLYDRGSLLRRSGPTANLAPEAYVMVHPADADKLSLREGDEVALVSAAGRMTIGVRVCDDVVPGVLCAPENLTSAPLSLLHANRWAWPHVRIVK